MEERDTAPSWFSTIAKSAVASVFAVIGASAIGAGWRKLFLKTEFVSQFKEITKDGALVAAATAGASMGIIANDVAERRHSNQLLADNIAMRSQLNQTGQILNHLAGQIEKGQLKDSELSVSDAAPPSHVAKLEAEKAQRALADAQAAHTVP